MVPDAAHSSYLDVSTDSWYPLEQKGLVVSSAAAASRLRQCNGLVGQGARSGLDAGLLLHGFGKRVFQGESRASRPGLRELLPSQRRAHDRHRLIVAGPLVRRLS